MVRKGNRSFDWVKWLVFCFFLSFFFFLDQLYEIV